MELFASAASALAITTVSMLYASGWIDTQVEALWTSTKQAVHDFLHTIEHDARDY